MGFMCMISQAVINYFRDVHSPILDDCPDLHHASTTELYWVGGFAVLLGIIGIAVQLFPGREPVREDHLTYYIVTLGVTIMLSVAAVAVLGFMLFNPYKITPVSPDRSHWE